MDLNHPLITTSPQETARIGQEFGNYIREKGIHVVCLYGELGSGKTTFAQGFAKGLGITTRLLSPTFIIVRRYPILRQTGFLYHIDLYRIEDEKALLGLGIPEILADPDSFILIEWAEKLTGLLPKERTDIRFSVFEDGKHHISICKTS